MWRHRRRRRRQPAPDPADDNGFVDEAEVIYCHYSDCASSAAADSTGTTISTTISPTKEGPRYERKPVIRPEPTMTDDDEPGPVAQPGRRLGVDREQGEPAGRRLRLRQEVRQADVDAVKRDLRRDDDHPQDWWPATGTTAVCSSDELFRHLPIRRGGWAGRTALAPISWPTTSTSTSARRLPWPIKQAWPASRLGRPAGVVGNVALESMGFTTFCLLGRDDGEPEETLWGRDTGWAPTSAMRVIANWTPVPPPWA